MSHTANLWPIRNLSSNRPIFYRLSLCLISSHSKFHRPANEITLIFGAHNVSKGQNSETEPQRKVVSKGQLFLHPKWDVNKTNEMIPYDLALIRLPEPITFNGNESIQI